VSAAVVEDGANWDILNAGSRTGSGSERRGGNRLAQQLPEWGQDFLLRRAHLVLRLSPICLQIDNRSPSGPWKHQKPSVNEQSRPGLVFGLEGADSHAVSVGEGPTSMKPSNSYCSKNKSRVSTQRIKDGIGIQQGEPMQASITVQVHPNAPHPIFKELLRDVAIKCGCK